jgi:hypothetical protein
MPLDKKRKIPTSTKKFFLNFFYFLRGKCFSEYIIYVPRFSVLLPSLSLAFTCTLPTPGKISLEERDAMKEVTAEFFWNDAQLALNCNELRKILILRRDGYSTQEIADIMKYSSAQVVVRKYTKVKKILRNALTCYVE